jgi:hypothetical protein
MCLWLLHVKSGILSQHPSSLIAERHRHKSVLAVDLRCQLLRMVKTIMLLCIQLIFKCIAAVQMWLSLQNISLLWGFNILLDFAKFCFRSKKCCTCAKIVFSVDFFVPDPVMMLIMTILF